MLVLDPRYCRDIEWEATKGFGITMPVTPIINGHLHRSESIMEHSGSGWPGNASSGSLPGSGILPLQLKAKLFGVLFADAVTSLV